MTTLLRMTARVRTYRTSTEVAGWRAQARADLAVARPTEYVVATREAALATLRWLVRETDECPATGVLRMAGDSAISIEWMWARDHEQQDPERMRTVSRVIAWYMLDPGVPTPL